MERGVVIFLLAFLAGPALAWLILMAGCSGASPFLGVMCGHNVPLTLPLLAMALWFLIGMLFAAFSFWRGLKEKT